jgi:hypothetical protein
MKVSRLNDCDELWVVTPLLVADAIRSQTDVALTCILGIACADHGSSAAWERCRLPFQSLVHGRNRKESWSAHGTSYLTIISVSHGHNRSRRTVRRGRVASEMHIARLGWNCWGVRKAGATPMQLDVADRDTRMPRTDDNRREWMLRNADCRADEASPVLTTIHLDFSEGTPNFGIG